MNPIILHGDALEMLRTLPDESVQCCVTSPPYWGLRDYGVEGQFGLEKTPEEFVAKLVEVFREVRRVLENDGTLWMNLGDTYAGGGNGGGGSFAKDGIRCSEPGSDKNKATRFGARAALNGIKPKDLVGIPWMVAFALRADGWYLRSDIIWDKVNPMPESVQGSHFSRHLVTVEEYENLSGLRYEGERAGDEWAGDMPRLSESEVPMCKAPLSAEREGNSRGTGKGRKSRGQGEAPTLRSLAKRQGKRGEVSQHCEGQGWRPEAGGSLSSASGEGGGDHHGGGLDSNTGAAQSPLFLLQKDQGEDDARSRNPIEQRRQEFPGKCGSGVQVMQLPEAEQDVAPVLVGCPGCSKCEKYHGYIFHLSAGRPTKAHEYLFLLSKSPSYYYDAEAIFEECSPNTHARLAQNLAAQVGSHRANGGGKTNGPMKAVSRKGKEANADPNNRASSSFREAAVLPVTMRNKRTVWTVPTFSYSEAHFATYPPDLIKPCILAGSKPGDVIMDPFGGSGTTGQVAIELGRKAILIELNADYLPLIERRCRITPGLAL